MFYLKLFLNFNEKNATAIMRLQRILYVFI